MSHWKNISIDVECSIEVLRRILINIMPKWEEFLNNSKYYSPSGDLTAQSAGQGPVNGCSIIIPMDHRTGVSGADIGFIQTGQNKWKMHYDYKPYEAQDLEYKIKQEYATLHTRLEAQAKFLQLADDTTEGTDNIIRILVPEDFNPSQFEV